MTCWPPCPSREREVFHMVAAGVSSKVKSPRSCASRARPWRRTISRFHRKLGCKRVARHRAVRRRPRTAAPGTARPPTPGHIGAVLSLHRLAAVAQSVQQDRRRILRHPRRRNWRIFWACRGSRIWEVTDPERSRLRAVAVWDGGPQTYPTGSPRVMTGKCWRTGPSCLPEAGYLGTPLVASTGNGTGRLALSDDRTAGRVS
jgi:hypothetical protein